MSYNSELQRNNEELQEILQMINELPDAVNFIPHTNRVPTAIDGNGNIFNGTGYAKGKYIGLISGGYANQKFEIDGADYTTIGIITGVNSLTASVYVYGLDFGERVGDVVCVINGSDMLCRWWTAKIKDGYSDGKLTVTKLAEHYYRLDLVFVTNIDSFAISGVTGISGAPKLTINEPIIEVK